MDRRFKFIFMIMTIMLVTGLFQFEPALAAPEHSARVLNVSETKYYKQTYYASESQIHRKGNFDSFQITRSAS